eukprot:15473139-Alexandrium_andersonii.AAC.1
MLAQETRVCAWWNVARDCHDSTCIRNNGQSEHIYFLASCIARRGPVSAPTASILLKLIELLHLIKGEGSI